MSLADILAVLNVAVAAPFAWLITALLWRFQRKDRASRVLFYQTIAATTLAILVTIFALIYVNNGLLPPPLNNDQTRIITRSATLLLPVVPALYWLSLYRRKRP